MPDSTKRKITLLGGGLLFLAALLAPVVVAQEEDTPPEMVTDRPDQTESSNIVLPGHVQFEIGYTHVEVELDGVDFVFDELPQTLARIGLSKRFELRQLLYGRRRTYRALFTIREHDVVVLSIRHSAQRDLTPDDL